MSTKIEWTDETWNPTTGCTKVSPGCDHCYAKTMHERFNGPDSFETVTLHPDRLDMPLRWRKPRKVFVNSMSDLFHDDIPNEFIDRVFDVMEQAKRHTFQVLTKRHARMRSFVQGRMDRKREYADKFALCPTDAMRNSPAAKWARERAETPPENIWLGVSVEDQKWADIRIPALLNTPAAVRFLSCEPLLGPVDLLRHMPEVPYDDPRETEDWGIHWVIVGGESGRGARPMHPEWPRSLRDQCAASGVAFHFKQWGEWAPAGYNNGTHLVQVANGQCVDRKSATVENPYGYGSGVQDLVDRGHPGWARIRKSGKRLAGRELDGRTWDEFPQAVTA